MDPLGFLFSNYDAIGAYHTKESGKVIDASGSLQGDSGSPIALTGVSELAAHLASHEQARDCVARRLTAHLTGRPYTPTTCAPQEALRRFREGEGDFRRLLTDLLNAGTLSLPQGAP
jgi:hypothetical protein